MWQTIMSNPAFQESPYASMSEDWFNTLNPNIQEHLLLQFGPTEDVNGMSRTAPILSPQSLPDSLPQTSDSNTASNEFVSVTINQGTPSQYVVEYNPATGAVRALDDNPTSMMMVGANEAQQQRLAQDAYNLTLQRPVLEATRQNQTAEGILNASAATGQPSGNAVDLALGSRDALASAQATAAASTSRPTEASVVLSRQTPATTPAYTGLEQFEIDNPYTAPTSAPVGTTTPEPALTQPTDYIGNHMDRNMAQAAQPTDYIGNHIGRNMPQAMPVLTDPSQPTPTQPVLVNTTAAPAATAATPATPATSAAVTRSASGGVLASGKPITSNARGSMTPALLSDRAEMLMRVGGAMYSGALRGDGIGAATAEYGRIMDQERKDALEVQKMQNAQRIAEARLRGKGGGGSGKLSKKEAAALNATSDAMYNYQRALGAIRDSRADGGDLTGIIGVAKSFVDNFTGDADAARRLILDRVRVDDALLRVAETKGAISNAEMKLFLAPAPSHWQDEAIWEQWLLDRMEALERVQNRLNQGATVPLSQGPSRDTASGLTDADLAYINN